MTIRVIIADDQEVVRAAFTVLLQTQPDMEVVATAADGVDAVGRSREHRPDIVLMDVRMPNLDGIEATRLLHAGDPNPRVIMLTTFDLDEYVYNALAVGASGFLLKDITAQQLFDAVRVVAAGDAMLAPSITRRLIAQFATLRPAPRHIPGELTARETDVLQLIAEGLSNQEIGARLVITEETVKSHVSRLLAKLGLRDRTQAAIYAYESGLVARRQGWDR
ncbi:response regulator [Micromonospora sp. 067-2]|uniref:response regulator n=1 Tax=Micromonospora sp. 067-2 TaxID=2789270 RepID=UPI00397BC372